MKYESKGEGTVWSPALGPEPMIANDMQEGQLESLNTQLVVRGRETKVAHSRHELYVS